MKAGPWAKRMWRGGGCAPCRCTVIDKMAGVLVGLATCSSLPPPPPFPAAASHPAVDLRPLRHVLPLPQHGTLKGESRACPATPCRPSLVLLPPSSVIISYYSYFRLGGPFSLFPKPCPPTLSSAKFALPPSPSPLPPPSPPPCDQGQVRRGRPAPCPPGGDDVAIAASRR